MKKEVKTMTHENFRPYGTYITWEEIDKLNDPSTSIRKIPLSTRATAR